MTGIRIVILDQDLELKFWVSGSGLRVEILGFGSKILEDGILYLKWKISVVVPEDQAHHMDS